MSISRIIINSSPLIVLFKSKQAELLPQLFKEIIVPEGVFTEVTLAGENDAASKELPSVSWVKIANITNVSPEVAAWDLGLGESQVLSLAFTTLDCAAVVDDRAARRCGQSLGITTIGTGGLRVVMQVYGYLIL